MTENLEEARSPFVLRSRDKARWRKLYKWVLIGLIGDAIITSVLFYNSHHASSQANYNGRVLRVSQYAECVLNNERAQAQIDYQNFILAQQRKSLEDVKKIEGFNTPEIRALALANQQKQIDATERFLKAYRITDCVALFGIDGKAPSVDG